MNDFSFSVPQNIIVGKGSIARIPELVKKMGGKKAFFISGPHLNKTGVVAGCAKHLEDAGIESEAFTETEGNPSVGTVEKATKAFLESNADVIIALGGGSPMDVAKAVGVIAKYGGSIVEYEGADKVPGEIVPLIAIPTTAGTGSEVTAFSVITDPARNYKLTVFSYKLIPTYAVLDPDLLTTVPAPVAAACGMDALIHALESYISKAASPFSDAMAEKAMELIGANIADYVADRSNVEAAQGMLVGSLFAGIAFSWARLGNVHAMSHPVSAFFHVSHGVANSILLPVVLEYNACEDKGRYYKIFSYLSKEVLDESEFKPEMLVKKIREMNTAFNIPAALSEVGVTDEHFNEMADDAMKSGNIAVNPRKTEKSDILDLYRKAL